MVKQQTAAKVMRDLRTAVKAYVDGQSLYTSDPWQREQLIRQVHYKGNQMVRLLKVLLAEAGVTLADLNEARI